MDIRATPPALLLGVALMVTNCGCGESNPFVTLPITGSVTYADGTPVDAAMVTVHFIPNPTGAVGDKFPQPGQATCGADGTFNSASTFGPGDGVIPGEHKVVIETTNADYSPRPSAVAAEFSDPSTTPLTVEVVADGTNEFQLRVRPGEG